MNITIDKIKSGDRTVLGFIVNKVFEELDFDRIRKVMEVLDWKWGIYKNPNGTSYTTDFFYRIPTKKDMKYTVRRLIRDATKEAHRIQGEWAFCGTGGFQVSVLETTEAVNPCMTNCVNLDICVEFVVETSTVLLNNVETKLSTNKAKVRRNFHEIEDAYAQNQNESDVSDEDEVKRYIRKFGSISW